MLRGIVASNGEKRERNKPVAAMWKATYRRPNSLDDYLYFHAADARSMSRKHIRAAIVNAQKRAKLRLARKGITDARIMAVNCVG